MIEQYPRWEQHKGGDLHSRIRVGTQTEKCLVFVPSLLWLRHDKISTWYDDYNKVKGRSKEESFEMEDWSWHIQIGNRTNWVSIFKKKKRRKKKKEKKRRKKKKKKKRNSIRRWGRSNRSQFYSLEEKLKKKIFVFIWRDTRRSVCIEINKIMDRRNQTHHHTARFDFFLWKMESLPFDWTSSMVIIQNATQNLVMMMRYHLGYAFMFFFMSFVILFLQSLILTHFIFWSAGQSIHIHTQMTVRFFSIEFNYQGINDISMSFIPNLSISFYGY